MVVERPVSKISEMLWGLHHFSGNNLVMLNGNQLSDIAITHRLEAFCSCF